jgi:hypothetical protein
MVYRRLAKQHDDLLRRLTVQGQWSSPHGAGVDLRGRTARSTERHAAPGATGHPRDRDDEEGDQRDRPHAGDGAGGG